MTLTAFTWIGIGLCISQAAILSGLNLAVFSLGRLRLRVEAAGGNTRAIKVQRLRQDANEVLATILWGNVAVNVLLTLLAESALAGLAAFAFSTFVITIFGEIAPQAYFSRNALRMSAAFEPLIRAYRFVLYPIAKPTAALLDAWLGKEGIPLYREREMRELIKEHIEAPESDIGRLEGLGALNFLEIDDLDVLQEGEIVDPDSVISLPLSGYVPAFPRITRSPSDAFLKRIQKSQKKWIVIAGPTGEPVFVVNSDSFLRGALFDPERFDPLAYCHRPIVVRNPREKLGSVISRLRIHARAPDDRSIDYDIILVWGPQRRVITGSDILGRLLGEPPTPAAPALSAVPSA